MSSDHDDDATRVKRADGETAAGIEIPGVTLGRQLGRGGMAIVFEGSDYGFNPPRRVAVKIMDAALSSDEEFRARFDAEASIVGNFRHANIVQVYASGETAGAKYMVMEYLPGGTLAERLRTRGALDAAEALHIAADLADALAHAHAQGIIHRDFKPANVLFAADGKPVLSDFGVAKVSNSEQASLTRHASVIGAPRYMAPEQERAEEVSDRADVYSFGMTLYETLTGSVPALTVLVQLGDTVPNELETKLAGQPAAVVDLIHRCLQASPEARPSAAECRDRLRALLRPTNDARPSTVWPRWLVAGLVGAGVLGALAVGIYSTGFRSAGEVQAPSRSVSLTITRSPATARVFIGGTEAAAPVLDIPAGNYTVTAVATGYYGKTEELAAHASPVVLRVVLDPANAVLSLESIDRFFELAEAETITAAEITSIEERSLATALRMKLLRQQGDGAALDREMQRLRALEASGDDYAPITLMLDSVVRTGKLEAAQLTPGIVAAADRGNALASYFVALAQRDGAASSDALFREYCARMRAAADGMPEVGQFFLQQDGCVAP